MAKTKPNTSIVMRHIIQQIRLAFPFEKTTAELCQGECQQGCPLKLLEYMEMQLIDWEERLNEGEVVTFSDIQKLTKSSQKIYTILEKNRLLDSPVPTAPLN